MALNKFGESLAALCREHPLTEKWLLAPSRRVARQWVEAVARAGVPVVNVRLGYSRWRLDDEPAAETPRDRELEYVLDERHDTLVNFARYLARDELARRGLRFVAGQELEVITEIVWANLDAGQRAYFEKSAQRPGFFAALARTIGDLRRAGVEPDALARASTGLAAKREALAAAMSAYVDYLDREKLIDYAGVLEIACRALAAGANPLPGDALVVYPAHLARSKMERDLLAALPTDQKRELPVDEPATEDAGEAVPANVALLRWANSPDLAPPPKDGDDTVSIFRAVGEANEVREVFRRVIAAGCKLDEVEIIYTAPDPYLGLIYETATRLFASNGTAPPAAEDANDFGLPISFADGIPVSYSRPGRALSWWAEWVAAGFPQQSLVNAIREGLLKMNNDDGPSFAALADELRRVPIGAGRDRYEPALAEAAQGLEEKKKAASNSQIMGEDEEDGATADHLSRRLSAVQLLQSVLGALIKLIDPAEETSPAQVFSAAEKFLTDFTRERTGPLDAYAREALLSKLRDNTQWAEMGAFTNINPWEVLQSLAPGVRVGGAGPRPGRVFVSNIYNGGHSGRRWTFIIGLDDDRFPGEDIGEPVLLDEERKALAADLPTGASRLSEREANFLRLLSRLRGRVTLSFPCYDFARDREKFPTQILINIYRLLTRPAAADAGLEGMKRWLGAPAAYCPGDEVGALDMNEWWMWRLLAAPDASAVDGLAAVATSYENLARGLAARAAREKDEPTAYAGLVPDAGAALTRPDAPPYSPSKLEDAATCLRKFFYKHVLGIKPPDRFDVDADVWLDAIAEGGLLHEVFAVFVKELIDHQEKPSREQHTKRMHEILSDVVNKYKKLYPPPSDVVYQEQLDRLQAACDIFLGAEESWCRDNEPVGCEIKIGLPGGVTDAVTLEFGADLAIRARGRIDRLDRAATGGLIIWDYKTGNPYKYRKEKKKIGDGGILQHYLYYRLLRAAAGALRINGSISKVGFFFPSEQGLGLRLRWEEGDLKDYDGITAEILENIRKGRFFAATKEDICRYCDYQIICDAKEKLERKDIAQDGAPAPTENEPRGKKREKK